MTKQLSEYQKNILINSCLNAGQTMERALERVAKEEEKLNKPKKPSFDWSNFNESDDGMM